MSLRREFSGNLPGANQVRIRSSPSGVIVTAARLAYSIVLKKTLHPETRRLQFEGYWLYFTGFRFAGNGCACRSVSLYRVM